MPKKLSIELLKVLLVLLTFDCLFTSCKKYADDDKRYWFKSPKKRLSHPGAWHLFSYTINGADSTTSLFNRYTLLNPYIAGDKYITFGLEGTTHSGIRFGSELGLGEMNLIDHKNKLNVTLTPKGGWYNPFINTSTDWDIKELTEKALKINATINGTAYEISFRE